MTNLKRLASALAFSFFLFFSTQAQMPSVSTVNVTPDEQKIRVSAVGDVLDMRVAVSDESGDIVFESGPVAGGTLDWTMKDPQGQRVPAGSYTMTVTYRTSSGKLKRRVEQVLVTEEVSGGTSAAAEDPTPQAVGTITGQGTTGKIAKFTGANSVGDSVMFESSGKIGISTAAPQQSLHAVGASSRLRLQSTNGTALTSTEYVTNGRVWQAGAGGSTAANGVANKFFVFDQTAGQFRLVVDATGNFGVGTTAPTSRLTVNGGIQILGAGNGIKFPDGSIQTKATTGTISGTGTANRLAKFTGPNSFGNSSISEVSGKVGIGTASPAVSGLHIGSGVSGGQAQLRLDNSNGRNGGINRWTNRLEVTSSDGIELSAGGISRQHLWIEPSGLARFGDRLWILPDGRVGIGISQPSQGRLHVVASGRAIYGESSTEEAVTGFNSSGIGVLGVSNGGNSPTAVGVYGANLNGGYAGYFNGRVVILGHLSVSGCDGCDAASDRNLKANISAVNPRHVLDRLAAIPIQSWRYKTDPDTVRHIGVMAQDFHAAFGLGRSDKTISAVDAQGVTMASIQALYQLLREKDRQIERQGKQLEQVQARLARVERTMRKKRTASRR